MKYTKGDIIRDSANFDAISHQCNCFQSFGAGVALAIKNKFPSAYVADLKTKYGDKNKLGTISYNNDTKPIVINLYGQYKYSHDKLDTNYEALRLSLRAMKTKFGGNGLKFGMPVIGAGLACAIIQNPIYIQKNKFIHSVFYKKIKSIPFGQALFQSFANPPP